MRKFMFDLAMLCMASVVLFWTFVIGVLVGMMRVQ